MSILRNRSLLIMAGAQVVSNLGNWVAMQAIIALLIFQRGGGVAESTLIFLCGLGPSLVLSPFAGWLVDRFDRRRLMIASELLSGLVVTGLIFATRTEAIYPLLVLASAAGTVMMPARGSVLPDVVPPADLTRANAFAQQVDGLTRIFAPLVGAGVVAVVAPQMALFLDVVSFMLSALILGAIPALPPRREEVPAIENVEAAPAGERKPGTLQVLRSVASRVTLLRVLLPFNLALGLVLISFDVTVSVYVRDVLQGSIAMQGMIVSLIGAGTGAASFMLMLLQGERNLERDYIFGLVLVICLPAAVALGYLAGWPALARIVLIIGSLLGGLGIGLANVQGDTLVQRITPDGWLGRTNAALQSVFAAGQMAGLLVTPMLVPGVVSFGMYFGAGTLVLLLLILRTMLTLFRGRPAGSVTANEVASGG